jgi:acyl carrier protein
MDLIFSIEDCFDVLVDESQLKTFKSVGELLDAIAPTHKPS